MFLRPKVTIMAATNVSPITRNIPTVISVRLCSVLMGCGQLADVAGTALDEVREDRVGRGLESFHRAMKVDAALV